MNHCSKLDQNSRFIENNDGLQFERFQGAARLYSSLSSMSASSASRSPFLLLGSCTPLPWACSPRRSRPGAASAAPGGLVPTLEVEFG